MERILVVDDERLNINVLNELLKSNYKIMAAINGEQALKAASSKNPPDLILLDIMMPEMDGYEVCKRLKADDQTKDIPIIFVTAMGQESDETKGLELGAADYITKPISPAIVEARVQTQIKLQRGRKDLQSAYEFIEAHKTRMEKELNIARDIQLSMLPKTLPEHNDFTLHAIMNAALEVGGDFYDYFFIDEDNLCLCVGDVSGKGVPASLFMAITKSMIKSRATDDLSTASIMTHVNHEISQNNESSMFITVFLSILNLKSGELTYTNAGHNPPFIKHAGNEIDRIDQRHGPVAGAVEGLVYTEGSLFLSEGDTLLLYTDGVTEAINSANELYNEQRLIDILGLNHNSPMDLNSQILKDVLKFEDGTEQTDDITILSLYF
jgi:sigma-B regulation protein RsbU (phosphoserine phosphatase)